MSKLFRRLQYFLRRRREEAELAEELEFHRSVKQQELERAGVTREEAVYATRREMGNVTLAREEARSIWIWPWIESVGQDLAYGARSLRRQPGFTLVALVALGSAIGLNTSLFTTFSALALRPWPVKNPERIVKVFQVSKSTPQRDGGAHGFSVAEYRYFSENARSFAGMVAIRDAGSLKLESGNLSAEYVSGNYFSALAVDMERGRGFRTDEDRPESPEPVAVISYNTWQNRFGSDPDIVGRRVRFEEIPFTVVGVASERFPGTSPQPLDVWIPLSAMSLLKPHDKGVRAFLTSPDHCCGDMAGRLAAGVSREQARAELELLSDGYRGHHKLESRGILLTGSAMLADPGSKREKIYPAFGLMFLGVMLVLLLACANVGNLLLARAAARRREIALRLSLGAGRRRVIRQLMTESLLLASIAGAIGIALAFVLPPIVLTRMVGRVALRLEPDATVLAFTLGISILSCLVFGLAPALHGTRGDLNMALKDRFERAGLRLSLRGALLAVQVAVSVVLLAAAGLLVRGVQHARTQDPGFAVNEVSAISFDFPASSYDPARMRAFYEQLAGEGPFGLTQLVPLGNSRSMTGVRMPGEDESKGRVVLMHEVSAGYFDVLRIPILLGRNFQPGDAGRNLILINQTMAGLYWPNENPVGRTVESGKILEIAGVVKDAYTADIGHVEPTIYKPISGGGAPHMLIRGSGASSWEPVAAAARLIDSRVEMRVTLLAENLDRWLESSRMGASIAGALGVLALALATIGVFGVFAYVLQQRTQEIGIRMALGAQPMQVVSVVLRPSSRALVIGLAAGIAGAMGGSRLIEAQLYGLSPFDPISYAGAALLLAAAGIVASYLPARKATRVDPVIALRYE